MKTAKNIQRTDVDIEDAAITMAIAVLVERVHNLPAEDKQELFEVSKVLFKAIADKDAVAEEDALRAYREILDQGKGRVVALSVEDEPVGMEGWIAFVSAKIKEAREEAGLTQAELEKATGLPQSHISRLENGVHSPSSATLDKIAKATGKTASFFDPSHSEE